MYPKRETTCKNHAITIESQKTIRKNSPSREPRQVGFAGTSSLLEFINEYLEHGGGPCLEDMKALQKVLLENLQHTSVDNNNNNDNVMKDSKVRAPLGVKLIEDIENRHPDFVFDPDESFDCSCGMISCTSSEGENGADSCYLQDTSPVTSDESDEDENSLGGALK